MPVMSPERPPSQSMSGTHLIEQSQQQQQQSSVAAVSTTAATATNMVLSAIPIETGHVVIHHHHPHQQQSSSSANSSNGATATYTQITRNGVPQNLLTTAATSMSSSSPQIATKTISAMTTTSSPSKYVVIHQNGNGQYRTADGTTAAYLTTQSNGVGNIVLLATEPMDVSRADQSNIIVNTNGQGTDEELTPLTWLQDKDLLKGLVVRTNGAKTAGATVSPTRQANGNAGGHISPTSDFMEDSSISEDNVSSLNSSSDQGISISSSEFSPTSSISSSSSVPNSSTAFATYHPPQQQQQQQGVQYKQVTVGTSGQTQTQHYINNNSLTKNRNHLLSPVKSGAAIPQSLSGTTAYTIAAYNGPSGTTTVVEYKAGTNFSPPTSARQIVTNHGDILSPQRSPPISAENTSVTITSASSGTGSQMSSPNSSSSSTVSLGSNGGGVCGGSASSTVSITTSTPSATPHQHYHKKYIREQMNGSDHHHHQQQQQLHSVQHQQQQHHQRNGMNEGVEYRVSGSGGNQLHHFSQQSSQQQQHFTSAPEPDEFHHRTPIKTNDSNSIYSNGHDERLMARESLNFESPMHNGSGGGGGGGRPPSAQKMNNSISSSSPSIPTGSNGGMGSGTGGSGSGTTTPSSAASPKQKHPTNVPYDPMVHTTNKPPYSFSSLIFMAIEDSPEKALPVKEIYAWIVQHFPYFKTAPVGWKNSVRHNLSLNKSFLKVEKAPNMGKGSLWRVEEHQRQNLIQALARSPFHQSSAVDKFSPYKSNPGSTSNNGPIPASSSSRSSLPPESPPASVKCTVNPELFPKLFKTMNDMANKGVVNGSSVDSNNDREDGSSPYAYNNGINGNHNGTRDYYRSNGGSGENGIGNNNLLDYSIERLARDCGADSIDDVNAATAMLALKHGPNIFNEHFQNGSPVITSSPSEDHTYSAGGGGNAAGGGGGGSSTTSAAHSQNGSDNNSSGICSDAAYESGDERLHPSNRTISAEELEEQRRHAEGVDALLSFASSAASSPAKRPSSTSVEEEHISSYTENIPHYHLPNNQHNGATTTTARYITTTSNNDDINETILYHHNHHNSSNGSNSYHHPPQRLSTSSSSSTTFESSNIYLSSSAATKKLKTSRGIRTKLKRKTTLIR